MGIRGSLLVYHLFDVCEAIRLEELHRTLGQVPDRAKSPRAAQGWFEPLPVVQVLRDTEFPGNEIFHTQMHYYTYGVVALRWERSFDLEWPGLFELCERWVAAPAAEAAASQQVQRELAAAKPALVKPYPLELSEDYVILRLDPFPTHAGEMLAEDLLREHGGKIAQIVRGDVHPLAPEEQSHILGSRLSYYPSDLIVAGWSAACVYDTASGAEATIQLIEYANTQLLEFRFYDELLTRTLAEVYQLLEQGTGFKRRWRLAKEANRLNAIRLEVQLLAERSDNAAKFLSDMFSARLYRLVSDKVGVPDYRRLVDDKLRTAGELYHLLSERVHQSSGLFLESVVVLILIIELVFLFRGKR